MHAAKGCLRFPETGRGTPNREPAVDALLTAGVGVVVITPRQVKHLRARYSAAGNKDDRFDA